MDKSTLDSLLKELHHTLQHSDRLSEEDRQSLMHIASDIQAVLGKPGKVAPQIDRGSVQQLQDAATRFEVTHPEMTTLIARVVNALSDLGF